MSAAKSWQRTKPKPCGGEPHLRTSTTPPRFSSQHRHQTHHLRMTALARLTINASRFNRYQASALTFTARRVRCLQHGPTLQAPRWLSRTSPHTWSGHEAHYAQRAATPTTIYALSTPPGKGAIAIIRISGPDCLAVGLLFVLGQSANLETKMGSRFHKLTNHMSRYIKRSVHPRTTPNPEAPRYAAFTTPFSHPRRPLSSTRALSSYTFRLRTRSRAKMCWSCMCTAGRPSSRRC